MNNFKTLIDVVFVTFGVTLLTGCPGDKSSEETGPASGLGETSGTSHASGETGSSEPTASAPERPEAMPMLCSIDGGKWCSGCPQGSAGPLCCAGETCAPWDAGSVCEGVVAWCDSYTLADKIAICVN